MRCRSGVRVVGVLTDADPRGDGGDHADDDYGNGQSDRDAVTTGLLFTARRGVLDKFVDRVVLCLDRDEQLARTLSVLFGRAGDGLLARDLLGLGLDVGGETMTPQLSSQYSLPNSAGFVVTDVVSGGPASAAGFAQDDIITSIGGYLVTGLNSLLVDLAILGSGTKAQIGYINPQGVSDTTSTTLGIAPNSPAETFYYL